jgi:hypothetical protein
MRIDALATRPHYADHVRPVFEALPDPGVFHRSGPLGSGVPTIVASFLDSQLARQRPVIYMEHGAGQTYRAGQPSYAGGPGKNHVALFLSPSEAVATHNRRAYPAAEHAVVGCPMIDPWIGHRPSNREPVVALAWHWEGLGVAPEARSAFRHYAEAIPRLPFRLLGHGHPRAMRRLRPFYDEHGIEIADTFEEVLERADVLVFDNTSAGFMFAATGRPVVVLDAPWYVKTWGGRFWDWADVGVRISEPRDLERAITMALRDQSTLRYNRQRITREIFGELDGRATERAVDAIGEVFGEQMRAAA